MIDLINTKKTAFTSHDPGKIACINQKKTPTIVVDQLT